MLSGLNNGIQLLSTTLCMPFDNLRVLKQIEILPKSPKQLEWIDLRVHYGLQTLWRGFSTKLLINFWSQLPTALLERLMNPFQLGLNQSMAGIACLLGALGVTHILETLWTLQVQDLGKERYGNTVNTFTTEYSLNGPRYILSRYLKGYSITVMGFLITNLGSKGLSHLLMNNFTHLGSRQFLAVSFVGQVLLLVLLYPLDTIRRIQMLEECNVRKAVNTINSEEEYFSIYSGFAPFLVARAISFLTKVSLKHFFGTAKLLT